MDATQMIEETFLELEHELERALDALTPNELAWRPNTEANGIGFTFWHVSRAEDNWVAGFALQQPTLFARDGWAEKWSIPAEDTGFGYGPEQLAAFPALPVDEVWEYRRAVRRQSLDYLKTLKPEDFDYSPPTDHPGVRDTTSAACSPTWPARSASTWATSSTSGGLQRGINQ